MREVEAARLAESRAAIELQSALARVVAVWGADAAAVPTSRPWPSGSPRAAPRSAGSTCPSAPRRRSSQTSGSRRPRRAPRLATLVLGPAPAADPLTRGRAYLLLIERDAPPPGSPLAARVEAQPVAGVAVPASAIVWSDGRAVVFVATDHGFERRTIERIAALPGGGWLVEHGVDRGEPRGLRSAAAPLGQILSVRRRTDRRSPDPSRHRRAVPPAPRGGRRCGRALAAWGLWTAGHAKLDVLPDFAPPQVEIQTEAPGFAPEQVEALVTRPIEAALAGRRGSSRSAPSPSRGSRS